MTLLEFIWFLVVVTAVTGMFCIVGYLLAKMVEKEEDEN